jgi:phosphomannomutase
MIPEPVSVLVNGAPRYRIVKAKAQRQGDLEVAYERLAARFPDAQADRRDGLRLSWPDRWVHLRPSGTEPILRIIAEAPSDEDAGALVMVCREALRTDGPDESGPYGRAG